MKKKIYGFRIVEEAAEKKIGKASETKKEVKQMWKKMTSYKTK